MNRIFQILFFVIGLFIGIFITSQYIIPYFQKLPTRYIAHPDNLIRLKGSFPNEQTIKSLPVGQIVYIIPWAIDVDRYRNGFISQNVPYSHQNGGTVALPIERNSNGNIIAYVSKMKYDFKWELDDSINTTNCVKVIFK